MTESYPPDELQRLSAIIDTLAASFGCSRVEAIDRVEAFTRLTRRDPATGPKSLRALQRIRMRRNEWLGVELFRDPAWDMLLELVAAQAEARSLSVSALCCASGVPQTTALRHIDRMEEANVVRRAGDFADQRRVLVALSPEAVPKVEALFREMRLSFAAITSFGSEAKAANDMLTLPV